MARKRGSKARTEETPRTVQDTPQAEEGLTVVATLERPSTGKPSRKRAQASDSHMGAPAALPARTDLITPVHGRGKLAPPWQPGESGNPQGKQGPPLLDAIKRAVGADVDALAEALVTAAKRGDVNAQRELLDRLYGKAVQTVVSDVLVKSYSVLASPEDI